MLTSLSVEFFGLRYVVGHRYLLKRQQFKKKIHGSLHGSNVKSEKNMTQKNISYFV